MNKATAKVEGRTQSNFAPFRHPVFRAIWIAMLFSQFGSLIQSVGAAWQMTLLTRSHSLVALVQASNTLPIMLFALFAGAIADSYDRRTVMLVAQVGMFVVSVLLSVLSWEGMITPYLLLALTLTIGIGTALNAPAWQASLRLMLPVETIPQAISLNSISFNLARSVGPAIGGLLISLSGPALNFAVNTLSYLGIIAVLLRWKPATIKMRREPLLPAIMRGFTFCRRDSDIRTTLFRSTLFGFTATGLQALLPLVARDLLGGDQLTFGLLLGAFGIGSIFAALILHRLRARIGNDMVTTLATIGYAGGTAMAALSVSLATALPALFLCGMGWVLMLTGCNAVVQMRAPDEIVGRCISLYHMTTFGGAAVGAWVWGALADRTDIATSLLVMSGLLAASMLLRWWMPVPEVGPGR